MGNVDDGARPVTEDVSGKDGVFGCVKIVSGENSIGSFTRLSSP